MIEASFKGYPIEIDMAQFKDELRELFNKFNRQAEQTVRAINGNEASTVIVEGTTVNDLPAPSKRYQGKLYLLYDPSGATDDRLWCCRWVSAASDYFWYQVLG